MPLAQQPFRQMRTDEPGAPGDELLLTAWAMDGTRISLYNAGVSGSHMTDRWVIRFEPYSCIYRYLH
jgi:hypothetical protein